MAADESEQLKQIDRRFRIARKRYMEAEELLAITPEHETELREDLRRMKLADQMRMQECESWLIGHYLTNEQVNQLVYGNI